MSGKKKQELHPNVSIGKEVRVTEKLIIQCAGKIEIGNNVLIARNVFMVDYNHGLNPENGNYLDNLLKVDEITIGDGVWIGNNVIILPGVHIGEKAIIGAGSVVTHNVAEYTMVAGNPATVKKKWNVEEKKWKVINNKN